MDELQKNQQAAAAEGEAHARNAETTTTTPTEGAESVLNAKLKRAEEIFQSAGKVVMDLPVAHIRQLCILCGLD